MKKLIWLAFLLPLNALANPFTNEFCLDPDGGLEDDLCVGFNLDRTRIDDLEEQLDELTARVLTLEALLAGISRVGDDIFIDEANLHVRNGGGMTDGANGLGNIIIGYNELRGDATDDRSGSHMFVLGSGNNFTSFGGVVSGELNSTEAPFSSIIGGDGNSTFSEMDFTGGFTKNMAIIGGRQNIAVRTGG